MGASVFASVSVNTLKILIRMQILVKHCEKNSRLCDKNR